MGDNGHEDPALLEGTKLIESAMENATGLSASDGAISESEKQGLGVLKKLITIEDEKDYLQILYLASFLTYEQASKVAAAIEEAFRYDLTLRPITTWVVAQCAVCESKTWRVGRANLGALGIIRRDVNVPHYYNKKEEDPDKRKVSAM